MRSVRAVAASVASLVALSACLGAAQPAAAATTAAAATSDAGQVPAPLLEALHWRSIGPFRGGRVLTVSGVPGEPARISTSAR